MEMFGFHWTDRGSLFRHRPTPAKKEKNSPFWLASGIESNSCILDAIERGERAHQLPKDFGLDPTTKVKDEIADAWAAARAYWAAYQVKISRLKEGATGTTESRNQWLVPLLGLLGYQLNLTESETLQGKTYRISHRDPARDQLPVHLIGWHESLDRRSTVPNAPRMSPHGLVQEYLNLTEHLYGSPPV